MSIVVLKLRLIIYLDFLHGINYNLLITILNYAQSQHVCYSTSMFEEKDWDISAPTDLNIQKNSYDCGVYVCMCNFMVCYSCFFDCNQRRRQKVSEGGPKFHHKRVTSQASFAFPKTAWFCFTIFSFLGSKGGHDTVAPSLRQ